MRCIVVCVRVCLLVFGLSLLTVSFLVASNAKSAHHDFGFAHLEDEHQAARFSTLLLYLNKPEKGGETSFPRWANTETFEELAIEPEVGKGVLFYSQLPDGNFDDLSHHAAKPVIAGEKYLMNLWVWDPVYL